MWSLNLSSIKNTGLEIRQSPCYVMCLLVPRPQIWNRFIAYSSLHSMSGGLQYSAHRFPSITVTQGSSWWRWTAYTTNSRPVSCLPLLSGAVKALSESPPAVFLRPGRQSFESEWHKQILLFAQQISDEQRRQRWQRQAIQMHCCSDSTLAQSLIN